MARQKDIGPATSLLTIARNGSVLQQLTKNYAEIFAYGPYGHDQLRDGLLPIVGYNAQPREFMGNYLLGKGYRAYSPALTIFLSPDIYSPFDKGGFNSYAYCNRDPINFVDPDGESSALPLHFTINSINIVPDPPPVRPRHVLPELAQQPPAPAPAPAPAPQQIHAPIENFQIQQQPSVAQPQQQRAQSLRRVPNNLEALVRAADNLPTQSHRPRFLSRIGSIVQRIPRWIYLALRPRHTSAIAPVQNPTYSAQRMHATARAYQQAQARNARFPLAPANQDVRTNNQ